MGCHKCAITSASSSNTSPHRSTSSRPTQYSTADCTTGTSLILHHTPCQLPEDLLRAVPDDLKLPRAKRYCDYSVLCNEEQTKELIGEVRNMLKNNTRLQATK